jgi:H+/Cl- antiporter ClcA
MPVAGALLGSFVGMLIAGVVRKLFPEYELMPVLAGIVAAGCLVGAIVEWHHDYGDRHK